MPSPIIKINSARETKGFFIRVCFLAMATLGLLAFEMRKPAEKLYPMNQTINEWDRDIMGFDYVKNRVSMSDLSAKDIKYINDSIIGVFQIKMKNQILPLYQMEQKRLQDSINASKVKSKN